MARPALAAAIAAALILGATPAQADLMPRAPGDKAPSTFTTKTLGEAAARIHDLSKPIRLEVRVALPNDRTYPLEPLHAYLKRNGFEIVAEVNIDDRTTPATRKLTLVGRRTGIMQVTELDALLDGMRGVVPSVDNVNWVFSKPGEAEVPAAG